MKDDETLIGCSQRWARQQGITMRPRATRGQVEHERGVTELPGLYFLGLPGQHTRGSALLGWVKDDAEFIAHRIAALARSHATAGESPSPLLSGPPAR
jgi:hypothetical protein